MLTAFLPCRRGSQRIPDKNIKPFAGIANGLIEIKLNQLIACDLIDVIMLSSNDARILDYAQSRHCSKILIDERPDWLGSSDTTTDQLIEYVPSIISNGDVLWTHVTSPFIAEEDYTAAIQLFYEKLNEGYDSLMTAKELYAFLWNEKGSINYNREVEKWPRTQTLQPVYEIDSGIFINNIHNYQQYKDRIGSAPYILVQEVDKSIDIDWPKDFVFAEERWSKK
jgi:CMP-N-acetylneuraminic acid synthetase